jgi:putative transposase
MSLSALRQGSHVQIGPTRFVMLHKVSDNSWQLQNTTTGEWCTYTEDELLEQFSRNELVFDRDTGDRHAGNHHGSTHLDRALSTYPPHLVMIAQHRVQYLREIDRLQPIAITAETMRPVVRSIAERIDDAKPPGWRTLARDYRKWLGAGRDIRAVIARHADKGSHGPRMMPEVQATTEEVIDQLYMTEERKRVPEVHLEIVRRLADVNRLRPVDAQLPMPSRRTMYRAIARRSPYELMVARYGKRRADMAFRVSGRGPETSRALQRVSMDHTPSDLIVVDDRSMLPLGRPTITSALDEHTRCPMGFYAGFEPPSCLAVMRCLKHAILPKTYVPREFPSIKNAWPCYGVPELVVVDNPPEFHSSHFERACLQIGTDIQYAKVLVPWYKGKLERFQGTMNHDVMHGNPGTTFSTILERDAYDPSRHAVVLLSTFREMVHTWMIDVYLQTPHRGITDTPAHRWHSAMSAFPPPLPPSAGELDLVLGMTAQRVVFHYGIELEGLKYNGPDLGELRRRMGTGGKVELTFDPGDLGHINVLDAQKGVYIRVPAVDQGYAKGLSRWQHRVIRRYAQRQVNARTDIVALAQAKAAIRTLVERDINRKATRGRRRHARFMEDHTPVTRLEVAAVEVGSDGLPASREAHSPVAHRTPERQQSSPEALSTLAPAGSDGDGGDDTVLPVFEAGFDLPYAPVAPMAASDDAWSMDQSQ